MPPSNKNRTVSKFNWGGVGVRVLTRENTVSALPLMFFLEFPKNFQSCYVKGQFYVHEVGTIKEMDALLRDLIGSALSLVMRNICEFKTF